MLCKFASTPALCRPACADRTRQNGSRLIRVCRATNPTDGPSTSSTDSSGVIFYAGKSYSEREWQNALKAGKVSAEGSSGSRTAVTNSTLDNLVEVMAFSGPAPEVANGRLAMLGFVAAAAAELSSGQGVISQWQQAETPITLTFVLFMAASLIPFLNGAKKEALGPFTPEAEMLNGRAAMIGFAALLAVETVRGAALF